MDYYEVPTQYGVDQSFSQNEEFLEQQQQQQRRRPVVDSEACVELERRFDKRDSSAGKLFVGGVSWETTEDVFTNYFSKYGEIVDSVIMRDKYSGRPRGFGFITFADPAVAEEVLQEEHVIDGRMVEVKQTVPREEVEGRGLSRTKKIFVGGLPLSVTEGFKLTLPFMIIQNHGILYGHTLMACFNNVDYLKEYFSSYGTITEHQIMLDRNTGRSRGFGFVTFENEEAVERILSERRNHEIGGKRVEIKNAEPKRGGDSSGSFTTSYSNHMNNSSGYGGGGYNSRGGNGGKITRGYGGGFTSQGFNSYGGSYGGSYAGFYGGYGGFGYGYGFGGPMYYGGGYAGSGYGMGGNYAGMAGYGSGKRYENRGAAGSSSKRFENGGGTYGRSRGFEYGGGGNYGSGKSYENGGGDSGERFHPYQK